MTVGPATQRVLIVDDEAVIRDALRELLRDEGVEVVGAAGDGIEGVDLALEMQPDAVVMDVRMPSLDGLRAIRRLKELLPAIRIVVLTAYDNPSLRTSAAAAGADAYVVKGTPSEALIDALSPPSGKVRTTNASPK